MSEVLSCSSECSQRLPDVGFRRVINNCSHVVRAELQHPVSEHRRGQNREVYDAHNVASTSYFERRFRARRWIDRVTVRLIGGQTFLHVPRRG